MDDKGIHGKNLKMYPPKSIYLKIYPLKRMYPQTVISFDIFFPSFSLALP